MTVNANSCEESFFHSREEYQLMHGRAYDDYRVGIEDAIKSDPKTFFGSVDLKQKRVGYPSVMHFYLGVPSDPRPDLMQDDPPFGALQFTVDEIQSVLLELDVSKGAGPNGIPPLFLKNFASGFARPLSLLFNRSLSTCVLSDRWKLFLHDTDIPERQAQQRRGLSWGGYFISIPKHFELLVYRTISVNQHGFMKYRSMVTNSIEEGWQVESVYTDF
jgi:hypothetical protein